MDYLQKNPLKPLCQFIGTKRHENTSPSPLSPPIKGGVKREISYNFPLPLWERVKERGIFGTNTISSH
jgi:hypothetical protein